MSKGRSGSDFGDNDNRTARAIPDTAVYVSLGWFAHRRDRVFQSRPRVCAMRQACRPVPEQRETWRRASADKPRAASSLHGSRSPLQTSQLLGNDDRLTDIIVFPSPAETASQ